MKTHWPYCAAIALSWAAVAGCRGEQTMKKENDSSWMDSPDVLRVVFHPRAESDRAVATNRFQVLIIPVADGVTIGGRFYAAGAGKVTILFFHGNGEIAADYDDLASQYTALGINFMPVDYRGYGRSTGRPTVASLPADARAVFTFARKWLAERGHGGPVVVMGRSLGSASAIEIAHAFPNDVAGLIVESGFADTLGLLRRLGADVPADATSEPVLRQTGKIKDYRGPVLIIHGTRDVIIPVADAGALFKASPSPAKRLLKIEGAGHNDLLFVGFREYMQAIAGFMRSATSPERKD